MRAKGWYDKPGVKLLEGRWQDFIDSGEIFGDGGWDVVYVDTFAEGYEGNSPFPRSFLRCGFAVTVWDFWLRTQEVFRYRA